MKKNNCGFRRVNGKYQVYCSDPKTCPFRSAKLYGTMLYYAKLNGKWVRTLADY